MINVNCDVFPDYIMVNSTTSTEFSDLKVPKENLRFVRQSSLLDRIEFHTNEKNNNAVLTVHDPTDEFLLKLREYTILGPLKERINNIKESSSYFEIAKNYLKSSYQ